MKKTMQLLLTGVLTLSLSMGLVACGQESSQPPENQEETITLKVGASPTPHAEILEAIKPLLAEKNVALEIVVFDDYVLPNEALANKELDANYFQHLPYLLNFNENKGTDLTSAFAVHYEPMGIYPGKMDALEGDLQGISIAVPNDATNEARALLLLEKAGLIKVRPEAGLQATPMDIIENPYNITIQELEAAQVSRALPDVSFGVINGNYALLAELSSEDALVTEDAQSLAAQTFGNILAVRTGEETSEGIQLLIEALSSDACKTFIEETYKGSVIHLF